MYKFNLLDLFNRCLSAKYTHVEESGDYCLSKQGDTLYIYLQWSSGKEDWRNNFDFPAQPYKDMPKSWKAHRGFVRVWKAIEPYIADAVMDHDIHYIYVIGYSHGAALTVLAHEYVWFNRPDIRANCYSFAFEAPRVFCGRYPKELRPRWDHLMVFRTNNDIVTHVPPRIFGFRHIGALIKLKVPREKFIKHRKLDCVSAHYQDNVILGIEEFMKQFK